MDGIVYADPFVGLAIIILLFALTSGIATLILTLTAVTATMRHLRKRNTP